MKNKWIIESGIREKTTWVTSSAIFAVLVNFTKLEGLDNEKGFGSVEIVRVESWCRHLVLRFATPRNDWRRWCSRHELYRRKFLKHKFSPLTKPSLLVQLTQKSIVVLIQIQLWRNRWKEEEICYLVALVSFNGDVWDWWKPQVRYYSLISTL